MRWTAIACALLALVLVSGGCGGGDDDSASDTTTQTDTTTDEETTDTTNDDTTTDETTTDDSGSFASGECADLVEAGSKLSEAFGSGTSSENFDDVSAFYDEVVSNAPEEIRADMQVLADAWSEYAVVLGDLDLKAGETPDPEALAKLQQALASIDQQEVSAAAERISAWTTANC